MLTSIDLQNFIDSQQIEAEFIHLPTHTPTVAAAAAAVEVDPAQIIKSVLFLADKRPVLVIASGLTRIDRKGLADYLGVSRRRVKIANADQVRKYTGYVAGAVPPFGHKEGIRTVVETAVTQLSQPVVYGGGGDVDALLRLTVATLLGVVGSETAYLVESKKQRHRLR